MLNLICWPMCAVWTVTMVTVAWLCRMSYVLGKTVWGAVYGDA